MSEAAGHLEAVGEFADELRSRGLQPILIGGMALVVLGSRRVTRDFDFVIPAPGDRLREVVGLLYGRGLELVSRLNKDGEVTATIAHRRVATSRLQIDRPETAHFYNSRTGLRIDLLFDFPVPAATLVERAARVRIGRHILYVASARDLLDLKRIAAANRESPGDAEDLAFLERQLAE